MIRAYESQRKPLDIETARVPRGQVYVIPARCKGCDFCIRFCPKEMLAFSDETNAKGYHYPTLVAGKESDCIHCQFCNLVCPEMAIYTVDISEPVEEETDGDGS